MDNVTDLILALREDPNAISSSGNTVNDLIKRSLDQLENSINSKEEIERTRKDFTLKNLEKREKLEEINLFIRKERVMSELKTLKESLNEDFSSIEEMLKSLED